MKISEFTTDKALDVFVELTPYVADIATSEALQTTLSDLANTPANSLKSSFQQIVFGADVFSRLAPILLSERRNDVYGILAVLNETSVDEIAKQSLFKTVGMIREIFSDKDLLNFFKSFVHTQPKE